MTACGYETSSSSRRQRRHESRPLRVCLLVAVSGAVLRHQAGNAFVTALPPQSRGRLVGSLGLSALPDEDGVSLYDAEVVGETDLDELTSDELTVSSLSSKVPERSRGRSSGARGARGRARWKPPGQVALDPKFRREGFFQRADLPRLDPMEFDQRQVLQTLSVEELEARSSFRWGLDAKRNDRRKLRRGSRVPREDREEGGSGRWSQGEQQAEGDSDPDPEYNPFKSRPLRQRMRKPRVKPAPPTQTAPRVANALNKTTSRRPKRLSSWLLNTKVPKEKDPTATRKLPQQESGSEDRVGSSVYRKMYKAVMRNYGPLPWERVEGQTSWLDPANQSWEELGMDSPESLTVMDLLQDFGVKTPNRLQSLALPAILSGSDVMLTSTTGSGKTLAFLLPLLHRFVFPLGQEDLRRYRSNLPHHLQPKILSKPKILVVAPGRELSRQTARVIADLLKPFPQLNVTLLVGKDNHKRQDERLAERQPVVIVGTPGKLMDHSMEGRLILSELDAIVFDEVDALLSMSRKDHLQLLLQHIGVNEQAQRILVSASGSMEGNALDFAETILRDNWKLVGPRHGMELPKRVLHLVNGAPDVDKKLSFLRRLSTSDPACNSFIVFCNNHERVRKVAEQMDKQLGIPTEHLTGNRSKEARDMAIYRVAKGQVQALVSTDAAMRGLDFKDLTHVVNFELPGDAATYAHRAGRCGRMGFNGIVVSLASGGYQNKRLRSYADTLNFELFEANVNEGVLGADLSMTYSPRLRNQSVRL